MNSENYDFLETDDEYVPYGSKADLEGKLFTIRDYTLVADKEQFSGDFDDTYEVVVDTEDGSMKFDVPKNVSKKTGKPSVMFALFARLEAQDHRIPEVPLTMIKNEYGAGKFSWKIVRPE